MRLLFLLVCSIAFVSSANAQTTYYYDGQGRPAGTAQHYGNQTQYFDGNGAPAGSSQNFGGSQHHQNYNAAPAIPPARSSQFGW